jgi:hypothetical protein
MSKTLPVEQISNIQAIQTPDTFIQQAIEKGSDVAVLSGLYDLKQRYDADLAKKAFHEAMANFQSIRPELVKTSKVDFNQTHYKFCGLSEIEKQIKEPLTTCGLSFRFENVREEQETGLSCIVTHILGHSERTTLFAPVDNSGAKNTIQAIGSRNTYLQRYTLVSALALTSADEDDDGVSSGDMPYLKLLEHNAAVRENMHVILAIKEALAEEDCDEAAMLYCEMDRDVIGALWVAPTKGGIFTTKEIAYLKSDPMGAARKAYVKSKGAAK